MQGKGDSIAESLSCPWMHRPIQQRKYLRKMKIMSVVLTSPLQVPKTEGTRCADKLLAKVSEDPDSLLTQLQEN